MRRRQRRTATLNEVLRNLDSLIEMTRLTVTSADKDSLNRAYELVADRIEDFTDSPYTSHEHRQNIILLCERIKIQLEQLVRTASGLVSFLHALTFNRFPDRFISTEMSRCRITAKMVLRRTKRN
jgi:hypothetical protein